MSCFMVGDDHINALVTWSCGHAQKCALSGRDHIEIAYALHSANVASVCERYPDTDADSLPSYHHHWNDVLSGLGPVAVILACDCMEYQCSDWSGWEGSDAQQVLGRIRRGATRMLPGYDLMPCWPIHTSNVRDAQTEYLKAKTEEATRGSAAYEAFLACHPAD